MGWMVAGAFGAGVLVGVIGISWWSARRTNTMPAPIPQPIKKLIAWDRVARISALARAEQEEYERATASAAQVRAEREGKPFNATFTDDQRRLGTKHRIIKGLAMLGADAPENIETIAEAACLDS